MKFIPISKARKGEQKANHKYLYRKWENDRWNYTYPEDVFSVGGKAKYKPSGAKRAKPVQINKIDFKAGWAVISGYRMKNKKVKISSLESPKPQSELRQIRRASRKKTRTLKLTQAKKDVKKVTKMSEGEVIKKWQPKIRSIARNLAIKNDIPFDFQSGKPSGAYGALISNLNTNFLKYLRSEASKGATSEYSIIQTALSRVERNGWTEARKVKDLVKIPDRVTVRLSHIWHTEKSLAQILGREPETWEVHRYILDTENRKKTYEEVKKEQKKSNWIPSKENVYGEWAWAWNGGKSLDYSGYIGARKELQVKVSTGDLTENEIMQYFTSSIPNSDGYEALQAKELSENINKALNKLSINERKVIEYVYLKEWTPAEVAEKFKKDVGVIESIKKRALKKIKRMDIPLKAFRKTFDIYKQELVKSYLKSITDFKVSIL